MKSDFSGVLTEHKTEAYDSSRKGIDQVFQLAIITKSKGATPFETINEFTVSVKVLGAFEANQVNIATGVQLRPGNRPIPINFETKSTDINSAGSNIFADAKDFIK